MFDTHCHLNFSAFKKMLPEVIANAKVQGVRHIVIPGTDIPTSQKAVAIAAQYEGVYAAVGIHPHHVYEIAKNQHALGVAESLTALRELLQQPKVVAVGEVGMDRHVYEQTKYEDYHIDESFIDAQKVLLKEQIKLAVEYKKSLILHNREAKQDLLPLLKELWSSELEGRTVFHCCEPDKDLLAFAKEHHMYIGTDGDITYREDKQAFIKEVPLPMLVLETDSPFLLPEELRVQKKYPNKPENVRIIAPFIAKIKGIPEEELKKATLENGCTLFGLASPQH